MKKKLLLLFSILAMAVSASAEQIEFSAVNANGVTIYYKTIDSSTCQVTYNSSYTSLTSVNIPVSVTDNETTYTVTWIGGSAFNYCSNLISVTIPESIEDIRPSAFDHCTGLTSVSIPNSVTTIGYNAFESCTALTSVVIGDHVTSVGEYAFKNCSKLTSVDIPSSVTQIGTSAFYGCSALTSVTGGSSIETIGNNAFYGCKELSSFTLGSSVKTIGECAFQDCSNLNVTIPNSVTSIGTAAFYRCSSLESVTIPDKVTTIEASTFNGCSKLASVTIPSSVTEIGVSAFNNCSALTSVVIPNSVTTIGNYAFSSTGLTSVTIPNSVTSIGEGVFFGTGLTSVKIPSSVTEIGSWAFSSCSALASVTIPSSVISIGGAAFQDCTSLTSITSYKSTPPTLGIDCFNNVPTSCTLNVPSGSKALYEAADQWSAFTNIVEFDRSYDLTITEAGLATLWLEYDATIPTGVEVYYAKEFDNVASTVKMTKITGDVLPRETGVIVKGAADTYTFNEADTEGTNVSSLLVGSATTQTFNETGFMFYKLTYANSDKENLGFYLANAAGTIESKPHKAYLKLAEAPASAPTRGIGIDWGDDDSTEIESIIEYDTDGDTMYNLQGMPVGNDYKGIVIKNGRKMMNK